MKKLAVLVVAVYALYYAAQRGMLPEWVPIPNFSAEKKLDIPPPSLGAPAAASQQGVSKWRQCMDASRLVEQDKTIDQSRAPFVLKEGDRVLTESERLAVIQEKQKFLDENCRDCLTPAPTARCR